ncbi:PAS domain-containing protein, partial [Deferrisoma sp.]
MSPTWIVPPLLGSLFLVGVYGYLFVRYREPFLGVWTWGWGLYTLRFAALVPVALGAAGPGWRVANQMFALWSGVLLFRGVREFQGKRLARGWVATGAALSAWVAAGPSLSVPFAVYTLPTFAFLGFVNWEAGRALLSKRGRLADAEGPARLTGTAFLLWAIHKWDYPFLARLPWAAPWGYALGAVLGLATAVGLLVTYLERERNRAERNRLFLRGVLDAIPDRVAVLDPELRVLDANRAAGIQAERHGGVCCGDVRGDSAPWCEDGGCVAAAALEQGVTVRATRRGADENGRPVVWDVLAAPLRDGAGRL